MELWIRSQDRRKLLKVDEINWFGGELYTNDSVNLETKKDGEIYLLGKYSNGKRALEVLDEIQKILKPHLIIKDSGKIIGTFEDNIIREGATYELQQLSTYVYEMPKE